MVHLTYHLVHLRIVHLKRLQIYFKLLHLITLGLHLHYLSSWTINCDGFVANGNFEFKQMLDFQLARTAIAVRFSIGTSPLYIISGTANITAISASGQYDSAVTYKVTLQGSGRYTIS